MQRCGTPPETIDRMPSTFMTYPMGGRILPVERGRLRGPPTVVELDTDYLTAFGWMRVPSHLWRAMRRNAAWIEPTLIAEWMRLMREYAERPEPTACRGQDVCRDAVVRPGPRSVTGTRDRAQRGWKLAICVVPGPADP